MAPQPPSGSSHCGSCQLSQPHVCGDRAFLGEGVCIAGGACTLDKGHIAF